MKLEHVTSDVKVDGDIERNSVGIDTENLSFILSIISSNLYSNPIESFIREITSNAWDSHVEAGTKDPVVIGINNCPTDFNKVNVFIQDFGTGLSPERFNKIFKNAGSSTKRDSNDQIGGFGIGRFSSLAVADMVHIISNYNGTKYTYLMYKDGVEINIDLALEQPTNDPNGVIFSLDVSKSDFSVLRDGIINQLRFFDNVFVQGNYQTSFNDSFNSIKIKNYNTFSISTKTPTNNRLSILLGKVAYPLDTSILLKYVKTAEEKEAINVLSTIDKRISMKFDIGELLITPNREQILYKEVTVRKIIDRTMEFFNELVDTKTEIYKKGLTYKELYDTVNADYYQLTIDTNNTFGTLGLPYNKPITVGGTLYPDFNDVKTKTRSIFKTDVATPAYRVFYSTWQDKLERYKINLSLVEFIYKAVSIPDKLSQMDRKYLRKTYKSMYLGFWEGISLPKLLVRKVIRVNKPNRDLAKEIVKEMLAVWDKQPKFNSSMIPQEFKDKNKIVRSTTDSRNYLVRKIEYNSSWFSDSYSFKKDDLSKITGGFDFTPDSTQDRLPCAMVLDEKEYLTKYSTSLRQLISRHVTVISGAKLTNQILIKHYPVLEDWLKANKNLIMSTVRDYKKHLKYTQHSFDFNRIRLVEKEFNIKTGINLKEKDYLQKKFDKYFSISDRDLEFIGTKVEVEDLSKTLSHPNLLKVMSVVDIYPEGKGTPEVRKIYSKSLVQYFKDEKIIDNNNKIVYS